MKTLSSSITENLNKKFFTKKELLKIADELNIIKVSDKHLAKAESIYRDLYLGNCPCYQDNETKEFKFKRLDDWEDFADELLAAGIPEKDIYRELNHDVNEMAKSKKAEIKKEVKAQHKKDKEKEKEKRFREREQRKLKRRSELKKKAKEKAKSGAKKLGSFAKELLKQ